MSTTANLVARLESLLGPHRVNRYDEDLREFSVDGVMPEAIVRPASAEEAVELVRLAASDGLSLIASGSRSKMDFGMPPIRYDFAVDVRGLQQIAHYDPGDMTLSVDAGMPLRALEKVLNEQSQFLPLAVPCYERSTMGGAIASGSDSILRRQYGNARDFLIGAEFVDGTGKLCKSGGRVVKNVSGYDLHKLLIGSLGTLGIITRLNFRTFPLPQVIAGFVACFADFTKALDYLASLDHKGLPLSNAELLDPEAASLARAFLEKANRTLPFDSGSGPWHVYVSYEGNDALVRRISCELQSLARANEAMQSGELSESSESNLSGVLREAFDWLRCEALGVALFRISLPQVQAGDISLLRGIADAFSLRSALFVRTASTIYFAVLTDREHLSSIDALSRIAEGVFATVDAKQGSAILLHAPQTLKQRINIWGSKRADHPLMGLVKRAFDPKNIFSPGRFVGGL
jgi:glycolate oxidase FAD binding subunit